MKPLIWKELRENVRWMPIGLLVVTVICWMVYPDQNNRHRLLATTLLTQLAIVTPLLAFAMGVIQTYRDIQPAAGAYLTHRGVTKSERFWAKVISGFVLYMTAISVPLLLFSAWIGYQGVWWFPMRPAQVIPSLVFAFGAFALHPAAMLMMVRNASWWGTRVFPIVPVALVLMPFWETLSRGGLQGAAWCLFFAAFVLGWIILTARQGWCDLATDPPTANVSRSVFKRWLLPTHLLLGTVLCYVSAVVFSIGFIENASRSRVYVPSPSVQLATEEGTENVWLVTLLQEYNTGLSNYSQTTLGGEQIQPDSQISAISEDAVGKEVKPLDMFVTKSGYYWSGDGFFTSPHNVADLSFVYDFRGYVLVYEGFPQIGWVKTISADGAHPPGELTGIPFKSNPLGSIGYASSTLMNQGYPLPYIGDEGVFFIDRSPIELRQIINLHVDGASTVQTSEKLTFRTSQLVFPRINFGVGSSTVGCAWATRLATCSRLKSVATFEMRAVALCPARNDHWIALC